MRAEPEVSQRKLRRGLHLQPRAVAVVPGRRSMQAQLRLQLNFCNPLQRLAQNCGLKLKLPLVGNVLVMASAALLEVGTSRFDAIGCRFDHLHNRAAREPGLLLPDLGLNSLPWEHKRHKHRHAATVRAGRGAGQAVTAVDQLFDGKKHDAVPRVTLSGDHCLRQSSGNNKLWSMRILSAFLITISLFSAGQLNYNRGIDVNLPPSVLKRFESEKFLKGYDLCDKINPFYLRGDFDGDGIPDYAILVTSRSTKQVGIAIARSGAKKIEVLGAGGVNLQDGSVKDFAWMDAWVGERKHRLEPNNWDKPLDQMVGEGIDFGKSEPSSELIYWEWKRYRWVRTS